MDGWREKRGVGGKLLREWEMWERDLFSGAVIAGGIRYGVKEGAAPGVC
jgi:hypothetical protein